MKDYINKNECTQLCIRKSVSKIQKNIYLSQIKRLFFTVVVVLFGLLFVNDAKAEEVKEVPKEMLDSINVRLEAADKEKLSDSGDADLSQIQTHVEYGDVTETGVKEINGRETPTYTTYKDICFRLNDSYIAFRVSVYYYYADGDYAEIYYYAIQKLVEFLTLSGDQEREGFITNHGTFSRLTIYYQVVFYMVSADTYIATIELDVDYWGEFSCNQALDKKYDLFPNG